jgi:hypothetical protein
MTRTGSDHSIRAADLSVMISTAGSVPVQVRNRNRFSAYDCDTQTVLTLIEDDGREIVADSILIQERSEEMRAQARKKSLSLRRSLNERPLQRKNLRLNVGFVVIGS